MIALSVARHPDDPSLADLSVRRVERSAGPAVCTTSPRRAYSSAKVKPSGGTSRPVPNHAAASARWVFGDTLGEAPQDRPVSPRSVTDDLATCLSRGDGHGLENDSPDSVHPGLHKVTLTEIGLGKHIRGQRNHAAVANPPHMNHGHARTSCGYCIYSIHDRQVR